MVFSCYIDIINSWLSKIILLIRVICILEFRYSSISLSHLMKWSDERWWEGNITTVKTRTKKNGYVEQLCSSCSFPRLIFFSMLLFGRSLLLIIFLHQDSIIFLHWIHSRTVFVMWRSLCFARVCVRVKPFWSHQNSDQESSQ